MVALEARLKAAPELKTSLNCKSVPIICLGSDDKNSIARLLLTISKIKINRATAAIHLR